MNIAIAHRTDLSGVIEQLQAQLVSSPKLVLFFASVRHDFATVSRTFQAAFPKAAVIGCSTAGEISSGLVTEGAISAMAIPPEIVRNVVPVTVQDVRSPHSLQEALDRMSVALGRSMRDLDPAKHVGLVLVDGLSGAEEALMDRLGDITDFPFIGGSAGDDLAFQTTYVSLNGKVLEHGAVLAVLNVPNGYEVVKAQSFRPTGKLLTATAVEESTRTVREFDHKPASEAYAQALGIPVEDLPAHFMRHPLGLMIESEPYVRSPQRIADDGGIVFYCNVRQGTELEILESADIVAGTAATLAAKLAGLQNPAGLINFNCILRALELKATGQSQAYGQLFAQVPTVGFSTYGEEYMGHINQTATMLVFAGAPA